MHPGFMGWWGRRAGHPGHAHEVVEVGGGCGPQRGWHGGGWHGHGGHGHEGHGHGWHAQGGGDELDGSGSFGVRRPLRFLAHKLELDEKQVGELAAVLDALKTERAQAAVDQRRTTAAFADAIAQSGFDEARAKEIGAERVKSAERVQQAVATALGKIHAVLDDDQRKRLAYLLRTGVLSI